MTMNHQTATGNYQNLFVAKLPLSVTNSELMTVFAPFSPSSATVMLDPVSGRSKGYAFVLFAAEADGRSAASALDKQVATVTRCDTPFSFDLTIFASKHSGREVAAENECLYIRNIPNSWPMARVDAFIAEHGKPVYSAVRSDHLGSPVWVVFVEYDSVESARKTLKAVHGMVVAPRSPPILAKYAESDDVKQNRRDRKMVRSGRFRQSNAVMPVDASSPVEPTAEPTVVGAEREAAAEASESVGSQATAEEDVPAETNDTSVSPNGERTTARLRIDVSQQLHHPCHASRYDASGERVPIPISELPVTPPTSAPLVIPRPRSVQLAEAAAASAEAGNSNGHHDDTTSDALSTTTTTIVVSKPASEPLSGKVLFAIPLPRSKQCAPTTSTALVPPAAAGAPLDTIVVHRKTLSSGSFSGRNSSRGNYISSGSSSSSSSKGDEPMHSSSASSSVQRPTCLLSTGCFVNGHGSVVSAMHLAAPLGFYASNANRHSQGLKQQASTSLGNSTHSLATPKCSSSSVSITSPSSDSARFRHNPYTKV